MVQRDERLISLDVFRGITIAGMILVNNPGSWSAIYPPLRHAEWNGWTPTDLIFPFFLFIVGVAMIYSFNSMESKGISKKVIYKKVFKRAGLLFFIGLGMEVFPVFRTEPLRLLDLSSLRILGVLQRIGLCYLVASVIYLEFRKPARLAWWTGGLLVGYWALMVWVPVPGYGTGVLTTEGNLATYIDNAILGAHTWQPGWEPEGFLSTIPAVGTVLIGLLTGQLLKSGRDRNEKALYMFVWAHAGLLAGIIVDTWFPINKGLWTSSYVLFTGGMALHVLAVCYWLIDIRGVKWWTKPFVILGMNALAVYVMSSLGAKLLDMLPAPAGTASSLKSLIYQDLLLPLAEPVSASLMFALGYVLCWLWVMSIFYRRKIFIKI
ncbi:MAG: DUF5009 domain-containing protein [Balneolaceae bacterium]|nr:DUF5009 domain-containing protein [Balneolaceae bacterium]